MAISRQGNVILAPGYSSTSVPNPAELLYSERGLLQKGVTLVPNQGVLETGTPLEYDTATKRYKKATAAANVVAFVRLSVDTSDPAKLASVVFAGTIKAGVIPSIVGVSDNLATLATAIGGKYNAQLGYIKF
jgi:hypothetical protein